jgi:hypothetical protein
LRVRPAPNQVKHLSLLSGAPIKGKILASPTNITLGWKVLPRTSTLAYHGTAIITVVNIFYDKSPSGFKILVRKIISAK